MAQQTPKHQNKKADGDERGADVTPEIRKEMYICDCKQMLSLNGRRVPGSQPDSWPVEDGDGEMQFFLLCGRITEGLWLFLSLSLVECNLVGRAGGPGLVQQQWLYFLSLFCFPAEAYWAFGVCFCHAVLSDGIWVWRIKQEGWSEWGKGGGIEALWRRRPVGPQPSSHFLK